MQKPVTLADLTVKQVCPSDEDKAAFSNPAATTTKGKVRDDVILKCVKAINRRYDDFKVSIQREGTANNVLADIVSLGATTAAPLVDATSAKRLAGAAAFVIGTRTAINTDIFYQQTLPAIESAMEARRDAILKTIIDGMKRDPTADKYDLVAAGFDLSTFEEAGNLYSAISDLTKAANDKATTAKTQLDISKQGSVFDVGQPILLDGAVVARLNKVVAKLYALKDSVAADRSTLDKAAQALTVPIATDFGTERAAIIVEANRRIQLSDANQQASAMSQLEALLVPILGS